jgi:hypothetical protein
VSANKPKISFLMVLLAGCDADVDQGFDYELSGGAQVSPDEQHTAFGDLDARAPVYTHASAGYLVLDDSPIEPWCGAVLVAPDVAMTSAACGVGFAIPNAGADLTIAHTAVLESDPRLAAVVLEEPVEGIEPASIAEVDRDLCEIDSVSYRYVYGDDVSDRWVWSGCLAAENDQLVPDDGGPNCHGDSGAPAFTKRGDLVGIVVAATGGSPCIDSVVLGVPGDSGAYDEALDLSEVI